MISNGGRRPTAEATCASSVPKCMKCGRELRHVEIGLTKKMINRGAREYMCLTCLSNFTGVSEEELLRKAEHFKKMGCVLF